MWLLQLTAPPPLRHETDWANLMPVIHGAGTHPLEPLVQAIHQQLQEGQNPQAIIDQIRSALPALPAAGNIKAGEGGQRGHLLALAEELIKQSQAAPSRPPSDYYLSVQPTGEFRLQNHSQAEFSTQFALVDVPMATVQLERRKPQKPIDIQAAQSSLATASAQAEPLMPSPQVPQPAPLPILAAVDTPISAQTLNLSLDLQGSEVYSFMHRADDPWYQSFCPPALHLVPSGQMAPAEIAGTIHDPQTLEAYVLWDPSISVSKNLSSVSKSYSATLQSLADAGAQVWVGNVTDQVGNAFNYQNFAQGLLYNLKNGRLPPSKNLVFLTDFACTDPNFMFNEEIAKELIEQCHKNGISLSFAGAALDEVEFQTRSAADKNDQQLSRCREMARLTGGRVISARHEISSPQALAEFKTSLLQTFNELPRTSGTISPGVFTADFSKSVIDYVRSRQPHMPEGWSSGKLMTPQQLQAFIAAAAPPQVLDKLLKKADSAAVRKKAEQLIAQYRTANPLYADLGAQIGASKARPLAPGRQLDPDAINVAKAQNLAWAFSVSGPTQTNLMGQHYAEGKNGVAFPAQVAAQKHLDCDEGALMMYYLLSKMYFDPAEMQVVLAMPENGNVGHGFLMLNHDNRHFLIDLAAGHPPFQELADFQWQEKAKAHMEAVLKGPLRKMEYLQAENYAYFLAANEKAQVPKTLAQNQ